MSLIGGAVLRQEIEELIGRAGSFGHPVSVTNMLQHFGERVTGRSVVTGQLSQLLKKHPRLARKRVNTGRLTSVGHTISEDAYWIDPSFDNPFYGRKRISGKQKNTPAQQDRKRRETKAVRIREALKVRQHPDEPIAYPALASIMGLSESAVRNYATSTCLTEPHVHRANIKDRSGQWRMYLWYKEPEINPQYKNSGFPTPRLAWDEVGNLVDADAQLDATSQVPLPWKKHDELIAVAERRQAEAEQPTGPRHSTIATRDWRANPGFTPTAEQFATAVATVNAYRSQNEGVSFVLDEDGTLGVEVIEIVKTKRRLI